MKAFLRGLAISLRHPQFAAAVWLAQAALGAAVLLPVSNFLHAELNHSVSAARLVREPVLSWWMFQGARHPDLLQRFPEGVARLFSARGSSGIADFESAGALGGGFLMLGLLAFIAHALLLGGIFGTLRGANGRDLATFAREGVRRLPAFLVVGAIGAALVAAAYRYLYVLPGAWILSNLPEPSVPQAWLVAVLPRLVLLFAGVTVIKLSADCVRVALVERPDLPPVTRYFIGAGQALGRFGRLFALLCLSAASTAALYFGWSRLDVNRAASTTGGLLLLVAAQQVFLFLRAVVKVGYYAGLREALITAPARAAEPAPGE